MTIAYLRVSTGKQVLENQKDEITRFVQSRNISVDHWITEIVSGCKRESDRKLGSLTRRMQRGDTLIVTELSRLSRTLTEIMSIVAELLRKGIILYSTKDSYLFDDSINSKVLCFAFGLVAEIERNLISMRTREALTLRKSQGIILGRHKGSFTKRQILIDNKKQIFRSLNSGQSIISICRQYDVSRETFNRFRRKHQIESQTEDRLVV